MSEFSFLEIDIENLLQDNLKGLTLEEIHNILGGSILNLRKSLNSLAENHVLKRKSGDIYVTTSLKNIKSFKDFISEDLFYIHTKIFKNPANKPYPLKIK